MHILIISYDFCLTEGGIQNTSCLLAEGLSKHARVSCLSFSNSHDFCVEGVEFYKSKYGLKEFTTKDNAVINEIVNIHNLCRIDYILCVAYYLAYNAYAIKQLLDIPYGVMCHGNEVMPLSVNRTLLHWHIMDKWHDWYHKHVILRSASDIFSNTNFTKKLVTKIVFFKRVNVINGPINIRIDRICENYKAPIIFSIGRLVERKGFQYVIKALPRVLQKHSNIQYIIAGEGPYKENLEELCVKLGLESIVSFVGKVSEEEKVKYFKKCGIMAMPSFVMRQAREVEGFGLVYIEANAYGKPGIGSNIGGIPEAINDNKTGFLVSEKSEQDVANILINFFDPQFNYNPNDCFDRAEKCNINNIADQYFQVINSHYNS